MALSIYLTRDTGFMVGEIHNNSLHRHYALQLSIKVDGQVVLMNNNNAQEVHTAVLIKPNVPHLIETRGDNLHIFYNPNSTTGMFLNSLDVQPIHQLHNDFCQSMQHASRAFLAGDTTIEQLAKSILDGCDESVEKKGFDEKLDPRLATVFDHLHDNRDRWVSAEECAALVFLSRSRFLHFFKEHTKCTFRRAQLWIRITHSMPMLKEKGLSETAFQYGFYDNAHYCRTFRENLGFSPQAFIKLASLYNTSLG